MRARHIVLAYLVLCAIIFVILRDQPEAWSAVPPVLALVMGPPLVLSIGVSGPVSWIIFLAESSACIALLYAPSSTNRHGTWRWLGVAVIWVISALIPAALLI